jgi:hypothetical protein
MRLHKAGRGDGALTAPAIHRRFAAQPIQHNGRVGRNLLDSERADQAEDQREFARARIIRRLSYAKRAATSGPVLAQPGCTGHRPAGPLTGVVRPLFGLRRASVFQLPDLEIEQACTGRPRRQAP